MPKGRGGHQCNWEKLKYKHQSGGDRKKVQIDTSQEEYVKKKEQTRGAGLGHEQLTSASKGGRVPVMHVATYQAGTVPGIIRGGEKGRDTQIRWSRWVGHI